MEYLIVILLNGKSKKYQQKLLYLIAKKFKVDRAILRKPPAHITLKYFFKTENIKPVEECIKVFCKNNNKSKFQLKGFNHFRKDVIFIDIIPSKEMIKIHKNLLKHLKNETEIKFIEIDGKPHFHSSIAHSDIEDKFDEIQSFVSKMNLNFNASFDNISILKVENNLLQIHKKYLFSK